MNNSTAAVTVTESMILDVYKKKAFSFDLMTKHAGLQMLPFEVLAEQYENQKVSAAGDYVVIVDRKSSLSKKAAAQLDLDWNAYCLKNFVRKTRKADGEKVESVDASNHAQQSLYVVNCSPVEDLACRFVTRLDNTGAARQTQPCDNRKEIEANKEAIAAGDLSWSSEEEYKELTTLTYADQNTEFFSACPAEGIVVRSTTGMGNDRATDCLVWDYDNNKYFLIGFSYVKGIKVGDVQREAKIHTIEIDGMYLSEALKAKLADTLAAGAVQ